MAACDYYSCDVCGGKAFYDANLSYDFDNEQPRVEYGCGMKLGYVGDMACICDDCAKTHKVEVVATSSKASTDDGEPDMLWDAEDSENCYGDGPEDFANNYASNCMIGGDECEVDVLCAYRGSNRTMKITLRKNEQDEELEKPVSWSWVDVRPVVGMVAAPEAKLLGELLARIHRDGGHRQREIGTEQAVREADEIIANLYAAPDMSVRDAARVRELECVIVDLKSECRNARDEALEEAAEHVEAMIDNIGDAASYDNREMYDSEMMTMHAHTEIAKRIRALRSAPIGADQGVKDA